MQAMERQGDSMKKLEKRQVPICTAACMEKPQGDLEWQSKDLDANKVASFSRPQSQDSVSALTST